MQDLIAWYYNKYYEWFMGPNSQYFSSVQKGLAKKKLPAMFLNLDSIQLLSLESHLFFTSPSCIELYWTRMRLYLCKFTACHSAFLESWFTGMTSGVLPFFSSLRYLTHTRDRARNPNESSFHKRVISSQISDPQEHISVYFPDQKQIWMANIDTT